VFENRALREMFGPKVEKVFVILGKRHFEQLHDRYYSSNILGLSNELG
jgi:hypothetical protein